MANHALELGGVFHALADSTRRGVVERLTGGPASTMELARRFRMALPTFLKHMDVLQRAGLVKSRKVGRVRTYELQARPIKEAERWIAAQRAMWERRLDQLDHYLLELKKENA